MSESENSNQESFSFVGNEHNILAFWKENNIFKKSLDKTRDKKPYIFYDGPPFATGLPHHGHLLASTLKDIVPRYWTMKGRFVERRFGWDCHGLPVEHEIDKKLGMSAQDAVEKLGVKAYNDECRGIVQRYTSEWEKTVSRIGRWVDFENDYKTMDPTFMESCWWVFKQLWEKNLVYQGTKVVPFSTALGTVLSNFEASSNYQDVQDPAITVLFKVDGEENTYFAAWTTTPWTLPSNLCLCVGADIDYVKVKDEDKDLYFYLGKARLEHYSKKRNLTVVEELKGSDLKGKTYEPLFDFFSEFKSEGAFQILNDDYVTVDDGTGIVHTAPAFGEDDNRIMKEAGIDAIVCPVDDAGKFKATVAPYQGVHVKEADKQIIKDLKDNGNLYEQSVLVHSYPFCPRSDTPLIYKSIPSWYIKVEENIEKLLESNSQINWVPGHIKAGRFGKWLEGARDWAVSRNRVWGTPLPIWRNDTTENCICVGSIEELKKLSGVELEDLHREHADVVTFTVSGEEGTYKRITEVFDCWFESGSMPYAQLHYPFENKEVFEQGYPAEFIAEGLDQTRGWFYTLTVLSTSLFNKPAFKNVIVNGLVMAEDGKKMSKSLRNFTPPDNLMEEYGADALRLYLINSGLVRGEEQRFSDAGVKDMVRRALLPWFNAFKFFQTYAEVDGWNVTSNFKEGDNIVDQWVVSKLQTMKKNIAKEMEEYKLYNVVPALFNFIEDLTNWYIRLNRTRFWGEGLSDDKCAAYSTLHYVLTEISKCMAPFTPFLAEYTYAELKKFNANETEASVHLCDYPVAQEDKIKPRLEDAVDRMQQLILLGRQKRNQVQIKVKTPLASLTIIHKDQSLLDEISKLEFYIQSELNIKEIKYSTHEDEFINLFAKPNFKVLGKKLGKRMGPFGKLIQGLSADDLAVFEEKGEITLDGENFITEDIDIFREAKEGTQALSNRYISIDMDVVLTEELLEEGLAREVVNRIQRHRKESGFNIDDRIVIEFSGDEKVVSAISKHSAYIAKETLSNSIAQNDSITGEEFQIEEQSLKLSIIRA
ncbi:isoleucine--tRNA ligase [Halobacteriovorax sp. JY17]|uniref:isoleucine--tRNA ligase n=1 Tax=Halobacteriovorax sp. JY17 TaxID=2014617 RepID=UPI000C628FAA|nr:isoleucine--tRNA ligase [Halobacteriovorax sp. JY17]PIK15039.1 MAG: isoleucine--tRNA ligase [Halobacteriovorax sp. JY17]